MKQYDRIATTQDRIREAMRLVNKKQADLVRETGLNRGTISRYLSGEVEPRHEAVHKLAVALDVAEMWLFGYDVPMGRSSEQKKNDQLAQLIVKLRRDNSLLDVCLLLSELPADQRDSIEQLLKTLLK